MLISQKATSASFQKIEVSEIIGNISEHLNEISNFRFIEKICRPIKKQDRLKIFRALNLKLETLNRDLLMLEKQSCRFDSHQTDLKFLPAAVGEKVVTQKNFRHYVRRIQAKYNQIFQQGSFKNYQKIAKILQLPLDLQKIDIGNWADKTSKDLKHSCC